MTVILFNKKSEFHLHIDNVVIFKREAVAIGFSEKKFRYEWYLKIQGVPYEKSYPCSQFEIHSIIA